VPSPSDATWRDDRHLDRTITSDEEEPMMSQEQTNHPAAGRQAGHDEVQDQACASGFDVPVGMSFDYIDEAIEESMDASDPPAFMPQTTVGPPRRDASRAGDQGHGD
jgi:hypothetical protein